MVAKFNSAVRVDWLSYTWKRDVQFDQSTGSLLSEVMTMAETSRELLRLLDGGWILSHGRAPYDKAFKNASNTVHVYFSHKLGHVLVELSGQACERLGAHIFNLITAEADHITRIDIAVDVECPNSPKEILDSLPAGRWRSTGHIVSDTGETVYVGSQKSDRYARVYRYNEPHPRAKYLRYEMVFRKEQAKAVVTSINMVGLGETAAAAGNAFKWTHGTWLLRSDETITSYRPERNKAKTERWFYRTIVPSIKKMIAEGTLTPEEVLSALELE